jgi:hypothetical protein
MSRIGLKWQGVCSINYINFTFHLYTALNFWSKSAFKCIYYMDYHEIDYGAAEAG